MKRVSSVLIGLVAGLVAGFIVSKIFLGPDWQEAFASLCQPGSCGSFDRHRCRISDEQEEKEVKVHTICIMLCIDIKLYVLLKLT